MNEDGSGRLLSGNGPGIWEVCDVNGASCAAFGNGTEIATTGAPAGSTFRVTVGTETGLSPVWNGPASIIRQPSVNGAVRANSLVTAVPGNWQGGWTGAQQWLQLAACRSSQGSDCLTLTDLNYVSGCAGTSAVIDPALTGRYLRVAARNVGSGPAIAAFARSSPYGQPVWQTSPVATAVITGRIAPPSGPRSSKCGPPLLSGATISKRGSAVAKCALGCKAVLTAKHGRLKTQITRTVTASSVARPREFRLKVPRKFRRVVAGKRVRLTVTLAGLQYAKRTVRLKR